MRSALALACIGQPQCSHSVPHPPRSVTAQLTRRAALSSALLLASALPHASVALTDGQAMQLQNAELETSPLIEELKRRTEANKEKNAQLVRERTASMGNVYEEKMQFVRYQAEGDALPVTRAFSEQQIKQLEAQGYALDCPKTAGMACRLVLATPAAAPSAASKD